MRRPFIFGLIRREDLSPLTRWKLAKSKKYLRLIGGRSLISIRRLGSYPVIFAFGRSDWFVVGYGEPRVYKDLAKLVRQESQSVNLQTALEAFGRDPKLEFFFIVVDLGRGTLKLVRDVFCTIPIFYLSDRSKLAFANEFSSLTDLIKGHQVKLDFQGLSSFLLALDSGDRTIFADIKLLTERSTLSMDRKEDSLGISKNRSLSKSRPISKNSAYRKFKRLLETTLASYLAKLPETARVASELSGGLDSSTVGGFYAKRNQKRLPAFSMILPGEHRRSQIDKLEDLSRLVGLRPYFFSIRKKFPLSSQLRQRGLAPFYPWREIYYEALAAMVSRARKIGVEVMFTGMGGDELFQTDEREEVNFQGKKEVKFRRGLSLPSFFTKKFRRHFLGSLPEAEAISVPPVPYSVLGANASRNNIFVEQGIWPVAPLADPQLVSFCRSLPASLRTRKKILREYQREKGYSPLIYDAQINESFANFFDNSLKGPLKKFLLKLYRDSILDRLGLIDKRKIIKKHSAFLENRSVNISPLYFYSIAVIEVILKSLKRSARV